MTALQIDVVSDVICPWCFLGKYRLDKALALIPEVETEVIFRPFFLDPTIPAEGMDRHTYLANKFGEERLKTLHDPLIAAGKADGVPFAFDRISRTPNTLNAHRLLRWAMVAGRQAAMKEALFIAYWRDGKDIGDHDILASAAGDLGLDADQVKKDLATDKDVSAVFSEVQQAQAMGITGVPTFVLGRRYGVVGAQSPELLADAIRKAAQ